MIEEQITAFVAAADVTDDCRVEATLRRRRTTMTAAQAREFAAELVRAAGEAERAAQELLHVHEPAAFDLPVPVSAMLVLVSPDCRDGNKHAACIGRAWDDDADAEAMCECSCHWEMQAGAA